MTIGVIQYVLGSRRLGEAGKKPAKAADQAVGVPKQKLDLITSVLSVVVLCWAQRLAIALMRVSYQFHFGQCAVTSSDTSAAPRGS